jgi:hypothetical protein
VFELLARRRQNSNDARRDEGNDVMKRGIMVAIVLCGTVLAAHADSNVYDDVTKHHRGDDALHADAAYCGWQPNGSIPSPEYRKCMLSRGWRYRSHQRDNHWVSPRGRHCQDVAGGTICSSF